MKRPEVREFVADQVERLARSLKDRLLPDVLDTFPVFGASLLKTVLEKLPNVPDLTEGVGDLAKESVTKIVESDPDIPVLSDIFDLSEWASRWLRR